VRLKFTSGAECTDNGLTFGQRRFLMSYPALIEAVLNLMSDRQSFFTSHNKLVIDDINYDSAEAIRRKIHICPEVPLTMHGGAPPMTVVPIALRP